MESVNTDKSSGIEVEGYCFINVQFERIPKPQILLQEGLLNLMDQDDNRETTK